MTPEVALGLFGASGVGAVLASLVAGLFSKRRLSAEATEIITRAASGVVANLERDNADLRAEVARERADRKAENEALRVSLQEHVTWDWMAWAKLTAAGITDLPEPPPLRVPPVRGN